MKLKPLFAGIAATTLLLIVVMGATYYLHLLRIAAYNNGKADAVRNQLFHENHELILHACRKMISNRLEFSEEWPQVEWAVAYPQAVVWDKGVSKLGEDIPDVIRRLDPIQIVIWNNRIMIRLNAPGSREYIVAYSEKTPGGGKEMIIPGLWYDGDGRYGDLPP